MRAPVRRMLENGPMIRRVSSSTQAKQRSAVTHFAPSALGLHDGRALRAVLGAGLTILTLATFAGLASHPFISYDDTVYITENPHVKAGFTPGSVSWALTATVAAHWHPVTWLSHMLDVELFGLDAGWHHMVSLLIHAANALLVFLLFDRITVSPWRSLVVASLFAVHPLHVESVAWAAERKDVLSTFFGLLTLIAWCGFVRSRRSANYVLACVLFALALMAKPMVVTIPLTMLLLDLWPFGRLQVARRSGERSRSAHDVAEVVRSAGKRGASTPPGTAPRPMRDLVFEKIPFFALSAASCVATVVSSRAGGTLGTLQTYTLADRVSNAVVTYAAYLWKMIWPTSLAIFYPHQHGSIPAITTIGCTAVVFGCVALAISSVWRAPWIAFGTLWYLITLVPVIGLVQVGGQSMADRYTYVPLIGIFVAVVWSFAGAVASLPGPRATLAVAAGAAILALALEARAQLAYWRSDEALYTHALEVTEGNWVAYNNLGLALFAQGRKEEAIESYQQAIRYLPSYPHALANLGYALADRGDFPGAVAALEQAVMLDPEDSRKHFQLAFAFGKSGQRKEAIVHYERALALDPNVAEAHGNLANLLDREGRTAEAITHYEASLRIRPYNPIVLYNLGNTLLQSGRTQDAIARLSESVREQPDMAESRNALGSALLRAGRGAEALTQIQAALRLKPGYPPALRNLRKAESFEEPGRVLP